MRAPLEDRMRETASDSVDRARRALIRVRMQRSAVDAMCEKLGEAAAAAQGARRATEELVERHSELASPADGTVSACQARAGETLSVGQQIVTVIQTNPAKAILWIPPRWVSRVGKDSTVRVRPTGPDGPWLPAAITSLSPLPDPRTGHYMAEVEIENPQNRLSPGLFLDARVTVPARQPQAY